MLKLHPSSLFLAVRPLFFHCIPALLSGLASVLMAGLSEDSQGVLAYHNTLYHLYPARIPASDAACKNDGTPCRLEIISKNPFLNTKGHHGRTAAEQALFQVSRKHS